jgi:hypothetical protein
VIYIRNDVKDIEIVPNPARSFSNVQLPDGINGLVKV